MVQVSPTGYCSYAQVLSLLAAYSETISFALNIRDIIQCQNV